MLANWAPGFPLPYCQESLTTPRISPVAIGSEHTAFLLFGAGTVVLDVLDPND
jgi:hypothetical protein